MHIMIYYNFYVMMTPIFRLFFGGKAYCLRLVSATIIETKRNFAASFHALFHFNAMLTQQPLSGYIGKDDAQSTFVTKQDFRILEKLINYKLQIYKDCKIDEYILNTFDVFCNQLVHICISHHVLKKCYSKLYDLIMYPVMDKKINLEEDKSNTNLFKPLIFRLFPNLQAIWIDFYGYPNVLKSISRIRNFGFSFKAFQRLYCFKDFWNSTMSVNIYFNKKKTWIKKHLDEVRSILTAFDVQLKCHERGDVYIKIRNKI